MSIPRPKRPTYRKPDETANGERLANLAAKLPKWKDVIDAQPDGAFQAYAPAALFEPGKVSILFEEGVKKLIRAS
jgi:hypothetical protein